VGGAPALYVTLEADIPGYFSANAFHLLPGEEKTVTFTKKESSHKVGKVIVRSYNQMLKYLK
jgi:hypothetical protein